MQDHHDTEPTAESLLIDAAEYARLLSVSERSNWRLDAQGKIPEAIELGVQCKRWRLAEVEAHVEAGMPLLENWTWPAVSQSLSQNCVASQLAPSG